MDKREANIDLVFRNGLKDFEVIPPLDAWDNIRPGIKSKRRPVILLSAAASLAVLLTLSLFAYRWSSQILTNPVDDAISSNIPSSSPVIAESVSFPAISNELSTQADQSSLVIENVSQENIAAAVESNFTNAPDVVFVQETNSQLFKFKRRENLIVEASSNRSQKNFVMINPLDLQYSLISTPIKAPQRWSVAAMASPTYYSRMNTGGNEIEKQLMASEQPLISYSGGVSVSYKINKRLSVQSGLYYSSLGQVVDGINSFTGFQKYDYSKGDHNFEVLTSNGIIYSRNSDVFLSATGSLDRIATSYTSDVFDPEKANLNYVSNTIRQNFSYLELPVLVRYKLIDKVIDFNLIGGLSYNLLVNNSVYTMIDGKKYPIGETEKLNPLSISSTIGMGMEYNFSQKLSMNLEPTLRYFLNPTTGSASSNIHPYSFGIFSGFSYKF
jgi:hypothetical protein